MISNKNMEEKNFHNFYNSFSDAVEEHTDAIRNMILENYELIDTEEKRVFVIEELKCGICNLMDYIDFGHVYERV